MPSFILPIIGELAALLAAFLWAASSIVYSRLGQQLSPLFLNLIKGVIALCLLTLTAFLTTDSLPSLPTTPLVFLMISGVIGISFGDTVFFSSLKYLGARRALLFETLAPPLAAIIALVFLQETLSVYAWLGILFTLSGVGWVITERTSNQDISPKDLKRGILLGLGASIAQAIGAVLSRAALTDYNLNPLWSTLIRLSTGTIFLTPLVILLRHQIQLPTQKWSWRLIGIIFVTAFASTYLGIWLQQISLKFTATGIAQTLSSTSPLFVLPMAIFLKETVTPRAIIGVVVALFGIVLLFLP